MSLKSKKKCAKSKKSYNNTNIPCRIGTGSSYGYQAKGLAINKRYPKYTVVAVQARKPEYRDEEFMTSQQLYCCWVHPISQMSKHNYSQPGPTGHARY